MNDQASVLIVDDSAFMRSIVGKIVEAADGLTVAGKAMNGVFALKKIASLKPDVIVLDLEMPEMNGIEFLKERKRLGIDIPVVILSSLARKGARITMEALSLGASDFVLKPSEPSGSEMSLVADQLTQRLKAYGGRHRSGQLKSSSSPLDMGSASNGAAATIAPRRRQLGDKVEAVALGISTGGPNALRHVFSEIDPDLPVPVLVVQHMPAGFTLEFAASLDRLSPLSVKEAEEGDVLKPGRIFIAPGGHHMAVTKRRLANTIRLSEDDPVNGHRPSADVLFSSMCAAYNNRVLGIIMTGMGRDGAKGLGEIYRAGGTTVAQDSESSVVYGMPRVAFENGVVDSVVSLDNMAETINRLVLG
jgi:two-component system, chemotaxis family, protein-glutamate methylesterase/glutaminase